MDMLKDNILASKQAVYLISEILCISWLNHNFIIIKLFNQMYKQITYNCYNYY